MADRILVVDDDPGMQLALLESLRKRGYDVEPARSAEEALQKVHHTVYDIIVLDMRLPGMSGIGKSSVVAQVNSRVMYGTCGS